MEEPTTYLGASSRHLHCENYKFQPNTPLRVFKRAEICSDLTWITITECSGILDQMTFKNLPDLEIISLNKCNMEKIEETTFSTVPNLKSLTVRKSAFPMDENMFKTCKKIDNLELIQIENGINSLLVFNDLISLEYLMIDHTSGLMLCKDIFMALKKLKYLFIRHCKVQDFSEHAFESLTHLETFYFTGNTLEKFNSKAFLSLKSLIIFGFYDNNVTSKEHLQIDYQMFENLVNLETINFPEEVIRTLEFEGFKNLKNVQLVIGKAKEDIGDFLKKKNVGLEWTTDSDLTEEVDFKNTNIQVCG